MSMMHDSEQKENIEKKDITHGNDTKQWCIRWFFKVLKCGVFRWFAIFFGVHIINYFCLMIYYYYCVDFSLYGILYSLLLSVNPVCTFLHKVSYETQNKKDSMISTIVIASIINYFIK